MKLPVDRYDAMALAGIVLIGVGCWMIYPPAAFIVVGVLLVTGAVLASRRA